MNDSLLRGIIKSKFHFACKVVNHLPVEVSQEIKHFSKEILESINECAQEMQKNSSQKQSNGLDHIPIE